MAKRAFLVAPFVLLACATPSDARDAGASTTDASARDAARTIDGGADATAPRDAGADAGPIEPPDVVADWEPGDLSQWDGPLARDPIAQIAVVTDVVRQGRYAARFEVRPGDRYQSTSGERAEVSLWDYRRERHGDTYYYAWSTLFPVGWSEPAGWGIVMQWHAHTDISPPLAFDARGDRLEVDFSSGNIDTWWPAEYEHTHTVLTTLHPGLWHDFIVRIVFRADATGALEVWHRLEGETDFASVLALDGVPTLQWSTDAAHIHAGFAEPFGSGFVSGVWVQGGLYRDASAATDVVYQDGFCRGASYASVRTCFDR